MTRLSLLVVGLIAGALSLSSARAAESKMTGFWGTVEGTVKTAKADGTAFSLTIASATPEEKRGTVKDGKTLVGKTFTLGTRMPKKDGKAAPQAEDVAYIKTLKPGEKIRIKVFTVASDGKTMRMQGPGEDVN